MIYSNQIKEQVDNIIDFNALMASPEKYKNKIIELNGVYSSGTEESALYNSKIDIQNNETNKAIWLSFYGGNSQLKDINGRPLFSSFEEVKKISGKKVKIRGRFNPDTKGHLSLYFGTIESIFYLEVIN